MERVENQNDTKRKKTKKDWLDIIKKVEKVDWRHYRLGT